MLVYSIDLTSKHPNQGALVRRQAMEIKQDVRALIISSSTDLPKALSTYLIDARVSGSVADDDNDATATAT